MNLPARSGVKVYFAQRATEDEGGALRKRKKLTVSYHPIVGMNPERNVGRQLMSRNAIRASGDILYGIKSVVPARCDATFTWIAACNVIPPLPFD